MLMITSTIVKLDEHGLVWDPGDTNLPVWFCWFHMIIDECEDLCVTIDGIFSEDDLNGMKPHLSDTYLANVFKPEAFTTITKRVSRADPHFPYYSTCVHAESVEEAVKIMAIRVQSISSRINQLRKEKNDDDGK